MTASLAAIVQAKVAAGEIVPDPAQARAVAALDRLAGDLLRPARAQSGGGLFSFRRKAPAPDIRGVYLHGGPGRGKSMLMDLFYQSLPASVERRRIHFHAFMIEVHDFIHARRKEGEAGIDSALPALTARLADEMRLLCLDEFLVNDVADAMILERLFRALLDAGLAIVTTSNSAPDDLYKGGLQRDRFEHFIALLHARMEVVFMEEGTDYRTIQLERAGTYFWPLGNVARRRADELFALLTAHAPPYAQSLEVKGRRIDLPCTAAGVARLSFAELCEKPHGAEDFLKIADSFHTVFLEGVPILGYDRRNEARRLILLIDVLYDKAVRLIVTADAPPDQLYRGHDHAFEFSRTISRLTEMGTRQWLDRKPLSERIHA